MKYISMVTAVLFCNLSFASINLEIENKSDETIIFETKKDYIKSEKESHYRVNNLDPDEITELPKSKHFIYKNYLVDIRDTQVPCAWINVLGHSKEQGRGLEIYINHLKIGTICANKTNILTTKPKARITIYKDYAENTNFHFYNIGWWPNESIFPSSININLTYSILEFSEEH